MTSRLIVAASVLSLTALAGCGKTGQLEQPAPLFGSQAKADYAAQKQADAEARARADAAKKAQPSAPVVDDAAARPLTNAPNSPSLPGTPPNPLEQGPQGALPNPATTPDQ